MAMDIVDRLRCVLKGHPDAQAAAEEIKRLRVVLKTAMGTLDQIATTPRNAGAKRNASATLAFLRTQMETPNDESNRTPREAA